MDYCQSKQLRPKTMASYEQTLKLFARWMEEEKRIARAEDVTEQHVREYIIDLQKRGKYTFCFDDRSMKLNPTLTPTLCFILAKAPESGKAYAALISDAH